MAQGPGRAPNSNNIGVEDIKSHEDMIMAGSRKQPLPLTIENADDYNDLWGEGTKEGLSILDAIMK